MKKAGAAVRWFGTTGEGLRQPTNIHDLGVSRNGRFAVTSDAQLVFRVFDLTSGQCTAEVKVPSRLKDRFDHLRRVSVSDDGRVVVGALDSGVVTGDVTSWKPDYVSTVSYGRAKVLPDGSRWARLQGWLYIYAGGEERSSHWEKQSGGTDLDVSADGRIVACFDQAQVDSGSLRIMSRAMKSLASIEIPEDVHQATVGFVDGDHVVALTPEGRLHRWDVAEGKLASTTFSGNFRDARLLASVNAVVVERRPGYQILSLATGKTICTTRTQTWAASADGTVVLSADGAVVTRRDPRTFEELTPAPVLRTAVRGVAFEPGGEHVWSLDDETVTRWSVRDGELVHTAQTPKGLRSRSVVADGSAAIVSNDRELVKVALPDGERAGTVVDTTRFPIVTDDGSRCATIERESGDRVIRVRTWDGKTIAEWDAHGIHNGGAFSHDGKVLVSCYADGIVELRQVSSGKCLSSFAMPARSAFSMSVSNDGKWLATCSDSPTVHVMRLPAGRLAHALKLRKQTIGPVALAPNARWVAASDGASTMVWRVSTGERVLSLDVGAKALAFSPSSKQLAIGGDGRLGIVALP